MFRGPTSVRSTARWLRVLASRRFRVSGPSMTPTLQPGDRLLIDRVVYRLRPPRRGEIVVFRHPDIPSLEAVKRIVGLPGERLVLRGGMVLVNGQPLQEPYLVVPGVAEHQAEWLLSPDEYLVLGDNRSASRDSRAFGPLARSLMYGPAWYRYWPPERRGLLTSVPL